MTFARLDSYLDTAIDEARIPELPHYYRGKVRDNYDLPDGRRIILATDRISAFDKILAAIPLKGQVLTQTARYGFEQTRDICPNHILAYPDPNIVIAKRVKILPVEMVVRDYLAGSTSTSILMPYKAGQRTIYGVRLPEGLRDNEKLPHTILTPTTKADYGAHDMPLSPQEILEKGLVTEAQWAQLSAYALALFARGRDLARARGLILVDTKYEFGVTEDGTILLADEIHTPDSSRYWRAESYDLLFAQGKKPESFDKDFIRNWVVARCDPYKDPIPKIPSEFILQTAQVYIDAFETITGQSFAYPPSDENPVERMTRTLQRFLKAGH